MDTQQEVNWSEIIDADRKRPLGVAILSWLHLIGGGILIIGTLVMLYRPESDAVRNIEEAGFSPAAIILSVSFIAFLGVGSGLGMLLEKSWGWYLAVYYYINSIFRNGYTVYMVYQTQDQIEPGDRGPEYYYFKYGGRVVIHFFLFLYLFKPNVLRFFYLGEVNRGKLLAALLMIYLGQTAILWILSMF